MYNEIHGIGKNVILQRNLRMPIRQPEPLFLLAAAVIQRPIPLVIYKMIKKRDDVPMQLCKCRFIDLDM